MNIKQISLIEPKPKEDGLWGIVQQPRLGLIILATILREKGYEVKVFSETISPIDWGYVSSSDFCGISYLTHTANEAYKLALKIKEKNIPFIMGGPHATFVTEEALKYCDIVVRGEGDNTLPILIDTLNKGKQINKIKGISFRKGNKIINNPPGDPVNINRLPSPDLSLVHNCTKQRLLDFHLKTGIVLASRGCPYNCEFCSVIKLFGRSYRQRSVGNVIKDIKVYLKVKKTGNILIADDNFIVNKDYTKKLLKGMIKNKFNIRFTVQIRANSANDEELVKLMKKAGVDLVLIGFESINEKSLEEYNKKQKIQEMIIAIKNLKKHNIHIHGMFVLGSDSDNQDIVKKTLDFSLKYDLDTIQFMPLTALPGTDLTKKLKKQDRIIEIPYNYLDTQHVNIFPKHIKPSVLQTEIFKAYKKFYSFKRAFKQLIRRNRYSFYCIFFGKIFIMPQVFRSSKKYIEFLKKQEQGRYDGNILIK